MSILTYNPEADLDRLTQLAVLMDENTEKMARFDLIKRLDAYLNESLVMMEKLADPHNEQDQKEICLARQERDTTRALLDSLQESM